MDSTDQSRSHEGSAESDPIPVAQLSPAVENADQRSFHAVVVLVWPFSKLNRSFSLLLADPDSRLRNHHGQVRVIFRGPCAEEVARTHVGIGDEITLCLKGAKWMENENVPSTPGKSLRWQLQFTNVLKLKATRNAEPVATLEIDRPLSPSLGSVTEAEPTTPAPLTGTPPEPEYGKEKWDTPAFLRSTRTSLGSPAHSAFDPFAEDDGYVPGKGRKRPRFSIPSSDWRVVDEPVSPTRDRTTVDGGDWFDSDEEELERMDEDEIELNAEEKAAAAKEGNTHLAVSEELTGVAILADEDTDVDVEDASLLNSIPEIQPSPPTPFTDSGTRPLPAVIPIQISPPPEERSDPGLSAHPEDPHPTDTPRLHPLASPDLPTPSPIVSTPISAIGSYFGARSPQYGSRSLNPSMAPAAPLPPAVAELTETERVLKYRNESLGDVKAVEATMSSALMDGQAASSRPGFAPQISGFTPILRNTTDTTLAILHGTEAVETHVVGPETSQIPRYVQEHAEEDEEMEQNDIKVDDESEHEIENDDNREERTAVGSERAYRAEPLWDVLPNAKQIADEVISIISEEDVGEEMEDLEREEIEDVSVSGYATRPELEADHLSDGDGGTDEELEDEPNQDEEVSEEEEDIEGELEDIMYSESEIEEEEYDVVAPQRQAPQRNVHPEIIVLDSDSDDGPPATAPRRDHRDSVGTDGYDGDSPTMKEDYGYSSPDDSESQGQSEATGEVYNEMVDEYGSQEASFAEESHMDEDSLGHEADGYDEDSDEDATRAHAIAVETMGPTMYPVVGSVDPNLDPSLMADDGPRDTQRSESEQMAMEPSPSVHQKESEDHIHEDIFLQSNGPPIPSRADSGQQLLSPQSTQPDHVNQLSAHEVDVSTPSMPTPRATQEIETHPELEEAAPHPSDPTMHPPDGIVSVEVRTTPRSATRWWTDGSNEGRSAPDRENHPLGINAKETENTEREPFAPELADEVVLVEDHSARQSVDTERPSPEIIKSRPEPNRLASGLRSRISYFAPLATLVDWYNATIDNISVVVDVSPLARATSGPRDYHIRLRVTDVSMTGITLEVHIFRPHWTALPIAAEGDVILLRNFQVQSYEHSMMLLSCESSAWAIFPRGADEPRISGPPVEYGDEELMYVKSLRSWYRDDGAVMVADYMLQTSIDRENRGHSPSSVGSSDASSVDSTARGAPAGSRSRRRKSNRRVTIHELINGRKYVDVGSPSDKDSIHELRDGTVYGHSFEKE